MSVDNTNKDNKYFCNRCRGKNWLIQCACGDCEEVIFYKDKSRQIRKYKSGHQPRKIKFPFNCKKCKDQSWIIECKCECGKVLPKRDKQGTIREFLFNHHFNLPENLKDQLGFNNDNWKGGRTKKGDYWYIRVDGEYKLEHVYFYEQKNKVCVMPWCVVHHIDHNKENNMPWNTTTMFWGEHTSYHSTIDKSDRQCIRCGKDHTYDDWMYDENRNFICRRCYNNLWYKKSKNKG